LDSLSAPLRDRMRILKFPDPGPEHLATLAHQILGRENLERGLDGRWSAPLDGVALELLAGHQRLVQGVMAAREQSMARA
jgi:hypothetical protein